MHDVIVIGGEDRRDEERIEAAEAAAEHLREQLAPGSTMEVTFRKPGRYQMATLTDDLDEWLQTAPVHVVVSVAFLRYLPEYNLTPVAKDSFWVVVGKLATTDTKGRYVHMQGSGEIPITQDVIAKGCRVSRQTASGGMQQLMDRSFLWKAGRGRYQIHPHLLYFGSAEKQAEAIGYAKATLSGGDLPPIPRPGAVIHRITPKGVKKIIA
ncbi:hypothetical protein [Streptomyces sp. NPDC059278]|uniref:hypothetical protein n=1 Tax=Streptomyces sp. NPDC059278 TaxID=3346801 RepID=UPI0036D0CD8D